jgi:hypothetical protein
MKPIVFEVPTIICVDEEGTIRPVHTEHFPLELEEYRFSGHWLLSHRWKKVEPAHGVWIREHGMFGSNERRIEVPERVVWSPCPLYTK